MNKIKGNGKQASALTKSSKDLIGVDFIIFYYTSKLNSSLRISAIFQRSLEKKDLSGAVLEKINT